MFILVSIPKEADLFRYNLTDLVSIKLAKLPVSNLWRLPLHHLHGATTTCTIVPLYELKVSGGSSFHCRVLVGARQPDRLPHATQGRVTQLVKPPKKMINKNATQGQVTQDWLVKPNPWFSSTSTCNQTKTPEVYDLKIQSLKADDLWSTNGHKQSKNLKVSMTFWLTDLLGVGSWDD